MKRPSTSKIQASRTEGRAVVLDAEEARPEPWFPIALRAEVIVRGNCFSSRVSCVSRGGVFIRDPAPPPVGELLQLSLSLPTEREKMLASASVVPSAASFRGGSGFTARFADLSEEAAEMWNDFVSVLCEMPMGDGDITLPISPNQLKALRARSR